MPTSPIPLEIVFELLIFGIVVAATIAIVRAFLARLDVQRRLSEQTPIGAATSTSSILKGGGVSNPLLLWVQSSSSLSDSKDRQKLRRDLMLAGFDYQSAPIWSVIIRFSLAIGLPILFLLSQQFMAKPATGLGLILIAVFLCAVGLIGPRAFVDNRAGARSAQLEHEFPDALDLMVVCVEAGLGLEAAFVRVGHEVRESHPRIADAYNRVSDELRAGRSRADALRNMADRTDVDPVKSFVALLIQTDTLGTSIGQTLRSYANEMREHRFLKAEEKAMRIPVLLTVPLVACILPVIVGALLLPPGLDVARNIVPALSRTHR
jgi:tight adherence protein C